MWLVSFDLAPDPSWLNIEPMTVRSIHICHRYSLTKPRHRFVQGFLLPGEQCDLSFTVFVSRSNAQDLNVRRETLDSTLILHTLLGKDHFISLSGQYGKHLLSRVVRFPLYSCLYSRNLLRQQSLCPRTSSWPSPKPQRTRRSPAGE